MVARAFSILGFLALLLFVPTGSTLLRSAQASSYVSSIPFGGSCWDSACYRFYPQIESFLQNLASTYPQIASLDDAGLSWEGSRHLYVMRLGSNLLPGPKPALYLLAEQRPRDIATAEMLLRWLSYLTQGYGNDPDVTWLLDNRYIYVMPLANPDGYNQVYNANCDRAKNTDSGDGCTNLRNLGTNLTLNYPFHWNEGGTGPNPCDNTYPGHIALSEPETQHILNSIYASSAGLVLQLQAPDDPETTPSVLYPWGYTLSAPPQANALRTLAWDSGMQNNTPPQAIRQYSATGIVSGILEDTLYDQGILPFTLKIGNSPAPLCPDLDALWAQQRNAFIYASKVVDLDSLTTLLRSYGPVAHNLLVNGGQGSVQFSAVLSATYGTVGAAVYSIDTPGEDGSGIPMSGNFGGGTADVFRNRRHQRIAGWSPPHVRAGPQQ